MGFKRQPLSSHFGGWEAAFSGQLIPSTNRGKLDQAAASFLIHHQIFDRGLSLATHRDQLMVASRWFMAQYHTTHKDTKSDGGATLDLCD